MRRFIYTSGCNNEFARQYGAEHLLDCLERNDAKRIMYHRTSIVGDYDDFESVEQLMEFLEVPFIETGER